MEAAEIKDQGREGWTSSSGLLLLLLLVLLLLLLRLLPPSLDPNQGPDLTRPDDLRCGLMRLSELVVLQLLGVRRSDVPVPVPVRPADRSSAVLGIGRTSVAAVWRT
jgi:hypothetical protein